MATARGRQALSQLDLAQEVGLTQQTVSKIERGEMTPSDATKLAVAAALGFDVGALFPWPALAVGDQCSEDHQRRWQLDMVLVPTFRCAVSGRESTIALRLSDPLDGTVPAVMLHPAVVDSVIHHGLDSVEVGLDHVAPEATDA